MKKIIVATLISTMALFGMSNNEIELLLISKAAEKKAVVLVNMELRGEKKEAFGKLYDQYQIALMKHRLQELEIISEYAKDFNILTQDASNRLIVDWVSAEESSMVLKKEYIAKFKKIIKSADVIRYFQIENRIQLANEMKRANLIPLAEPAIEQQVQSNTFQ